MGFNYFYLEKIIEIEEIKKMGGKEKDEQISSGMLVGGTNIVSRRTLQHFKKLIPLSFSFP